MEGDGEVEVEARFGSFDFTAATTASTLGPTHHATRGVRVIDKNHRRGTRPSQSKHFKSTRAVSAFVAKVPRLLAIISAILSGTTPMKLMISSMVISPREATVKQMA